MAYHKDRIYIYKELIEEYIRRIPKKKGVHDKFKR
jgi:hypothetical protein